MVLHGDATFAFRVPSLGKGTLLAEAVTHVPGLEGSGALLTIVDERLRIRLICGVQKAALRNLVHSLDRTLAPDGIRAVSVTVDGVIDRDHPGSPLHPDQIAAAIHAAAHQPEKTWRSEVRHPST